LLPVTLVPFSTSLLAEFLDLAWPWHLLAEILLLRLQRFMRGGATRVTLI